MKSNGYDVLFVLESLFSQQSLIKMSKRTAPCESEDDSGVCGKVHKSDNNSIADDVCRRLQQRYDSSCFQHEFYIYQLQHLMRYTACITWLLNTLKFSPPDIVYIVLLAVFASEHILFNDGCAHADLLILPKEKCLQLISFISSMYLPIFSVLLFSFFFFFFSLILSFSIFCCFVNPAVVCGGTLSCWKVQKLNCSHKCVKVVVLGIFVATMVKLQRLVISEPDKARHQYRAAIQQVCQHRL